MNITRLITLLLAALCCSLSAKAATIDTVPIGNPGNAGDVQPRGRLGAVAANYRIGRTEAP